MRIIIISSLFSLFLSCSSAESKEKKQTGIPSANENQTQKTELAKQSSVTDGPAIAEMETSDFILKIHRVIPFELAPKSYQPVKVKEGHKLVVLDISVRSKSGAPINMGQVLIMTEALDGKGRNNIAQWVVGAYMTDHPDAGHQPEYDALWSNQFSAGEFHRSILLGLDLLKEEKTILLAIPEKPDYNAPKKQLKISIE